MINAAVVGLGWWGQNILKNLVNSPVIKPVLGVDPLESARASAAALGVETAPRFEDALAHPTLYTTAFTGDWPTPSTVPKTRSKPARKASSASLIICSLSSSTGDS
jgi:hypothetical protein